MPYASEVHVDAPLSNLASQYMGLTGEFAAGTICPVLKVAKESDKYFVFGHEQTVPLGDIIGERSEAAEVDWHVTTASYATVARALKGFVSSRSVANSDSAVRPMITTQQKIINTLLLNKEIRVVAAVVAAITATSQTTAIGDAWATAASGLPLANIMAGNEALRAATGQYGTHVVIPASVVPVMVACAEWQQQVYYTHSDNIENYGVLPPKICGLIPVVPTTMKANTDLLNLYYDPNHANFADLPSMAEVWTSDSVYILRVNPRPSLEDPSFMYDITSTKMRTRKWFDPKRGFGGGTYVQCEYQAVEKTINAYYAWELDNVI